MSSIVDLGQFVS